MSTRISTAQMFDMSRAHVAQAQEKESISSEKASTQKEIVRPSQDPAGWTRAANLKDSLSINESIHKNSALAQHMLTATESVLGGLQDYVQRVHELAISAAGTDAATGPTRNGVLAEVSTIFDNMVQSANSRYLNRTLLSGLKSQSPAFDGQGNFIGDDGKFEIEIDQGLVVPINTSGARALLGQGITGGVDIMAAMRRLITGLSTNDTTAIQSSLDDLYKGNEQLSAMRAEVGGRMAQINKMIDAGEVNKIQALDSISKVEDADAAKVFSDLARDQTVLKAAVSTTQKIINELPTETLFK